MKIFVYSVFDQAVKAFGQPVFFRSQGEALRSWMDACADVKSNMNKHAKDYTFFELGEYDDTKGCFLNLTTPVAVMSALQALPVAGLQAEVSDPALMDALRSSVLQSPPGRQNGGL
jgi:hypothetical protein